MSKRKAPILCDLGLYFKFVPENNTSICMIENCLKVFKGNVGGNLRRHIKTCHTELAQSINLVISEVNDSENTSDENIIPFPTSSKRRKVVYSQNTIKRACVTLCTVRGLPFSFFDTPESKFLLEPLFAKYNMAITSKNIIGNIGIAADRVRDLISTEIKGRLISLKVDSASRGGRSVLGINCQFVENGNICVRTLAMLELFNNQTAVFLKSKIVEVLNVYKIKTTQIYSITIDNGANMVKAATLIGEESPIDLSGLPNGEMEDDENTQIQEEMSLVVEDALSLIATPIRCAAHTFQLAIRDVLKKGNFTETINSIRSVVKKLRSVKYKSFFTVNKIPRPGLDCDTRWGSTYLMINTFFVRKSQYAVIENEIGLDDAIWRFIEQFEPSFKIMFMLTKKLQAENLIMGDLFLLYLETTIKLKAISDENPFKQMLLDAIEKRKLQLFENDAFRCGMFFDPRFTYKGSSFFPSEHIETTKVRIKDIHVPILCKKDFLVAFGFLKLL